MTSWMEVLLIITTYCAGSHPVVGQTQDVNKCRNDRLLCVRQAAETSPKSNAEMLVNGCLNDPMSYLKFIPPAQPQEPKKSIDLSTSNLKKKGK